MRLMNLKKRREQIKQDLVLLKDDKTGLGYKEFVLDEVMFSKFIKEVRQLLSKDKSYQKLKEVLDLMVIEAELVDIAVGEVNVLLGIEKSIQDSTSIDFVPEFIAFTINKVL